MPKIPGLKVIAAPVDPPENPGDLTEVEVAEIIQFPGELVPVSVEPILAIQRNLQTLANRGQNDKRVGVEDFDIAQTKHTSHPSNPVLNQPDLLAFRHKQTKKSTEASSAPPPGWSVSLDLYHESTAHRLVRLGPE